MSKVLSVSTIEDANLYKELLKRNNSETRTLVGNLLSLCTDASDRAKSISKYFPEFTLHDQTHFLRVTQLMALVVGKNLLQLNDLELSLLILSAFFHDQGMVLSDDEKETLLNNNAFIIFKENWFVDHPNYLETKNQLDDPAISKAEYMRICKAVQSLESAMLIDYLRIEHGKRAYDYIIQTHTNDRRMEISGINLSPFLAILCLSHVQSTDWLKANPQINVDENIGTYRVNMTFLCLVLRLSDILDFDADRTPEVLFRSIHFTSPVSVMEWQKHRSVQGWEISPSMVRFTMSFEHPVYEKCARDFLDWIDNELVESHQVTRGFPTGQSGYRIDLPEKTDRNRISAKNNAYVFHDLEFSLSRNEVVKLLMTNNLYKSPSLFIRELLQNSLDALRLREANFEKEGLAWTQGKVSFRHAINEKDEYFVECIDNGCGMDIDVVSRFFGKVGRSYYRSPEFQRHRLTLKEKGVDFEPCSQFGIGFMSCFMVGDRIEIATRKDYGVGQALGAPLRIEINGLGGLMVIRDGDKDQLVGTSVKVYSRDKPLIYDEWSDDINLLQVIKGYVLGNEFPIEAICDIEGIKGSIVIPAELDIKRTFLEEQGLQSIKTFEVDLTTVHPDLHGFLKQSFLVDSRGRICMENDEAKWVIVPDAKWKDNPFKVAILLKETQKTEIFERHVRDAHSICLDGILICGSPGRSFHHRYELMRLGNRSALVHSEHPFTIDIRGAIKPEISPAREPADGEGIFNLPIGWRRLQYLIDLGGGNLWQKVLSETSPELFWTLLTLYDGDPMDIPSQALFKFIALPIIDQSWIPISEIKCVVKTDDRISVLNRNDEILDLQMPDSITRHYRQNGTVPKDWNYWFRKTLIGLSYIELIDGKIVLKLRRNFMDRERPVEKKFHAFNSNCYCIEFSGLDNRYLCTIDFEDIVNKNNPVVAKGFKNYLDETNDYFHNFASSLISIVPPFIKHLKENHKDISFDYRGRYLKILGAKYMRVNWAKYEACLKPPYKVYVDEYKTVEITDELLRRWAMIKLNEED